MTAPRALRVEHLDGMPLGVGDRRPRLSWQLPDGCSEQRAFTIEIDGHAHEPVHSPEHVLVPWPSAPVTSRQRVSWRVKVTTDAGESSWSAPAWFEAGLLDVGDWDARCVSPEVEREATALLRGSFTVPSQVDRARLYITALGVLEAELNGRRVGDHFMDPGWTSYHHRLRYETFDVIDLVQEGPNTLGARLAEGWYKGRLGFGGGARGPSRYGDRIGLLAQLEVTTTDGGLHRLVTDENWRWLAGPTTRASIYDGEDHDARLERPGWSSPDYLDVWWQPVDVLEHDLHTLVAPTGPPVRVIESVDPVATSTSPTGRTIVDFGQNLVGRPVLTAQGPYGAEVVLRHAEVLEGGELCTEPLRFADAKDHFVLAGGGAPQTWAPRFTFHGFRYAEVTGPYTDLKAEVCHSDLRRTGWFECSDERVNRLHENVVWSMRGNFLDVPTDCPQRDERLGWTGDLTVFAPTACFLYDVAGFLTSWLADLAAEQDDEGPPLVIPCIPGVMKLRSAVWGDAATEVPSVLHERYGDLGILARQYPSMRRWIETIIRDTNPPGHWDNYFHFGDHLDPTAPRDDAGAGRTDRHLVGNAWFCHTAGRVAAAAELLGRSDDAARYREVEALAKADFGQRYIERDGTMTSDSQTAYALAIRFGLVDGDRRVAAGQRLVELVEEEGHRIGNGFVGTPIVGDALCDVGAVDTAYRLLLQTECPSWLYPLQHGATTIWERWDAIGPDGTRYSDEMNSFNHYALGAVADWLHRRVAGLAPAEPGYRRLLVKPLPGPGLDHATARLDTPYGRAEAGWHRDGAEVVVRAVVPPGATATVELPDGSAAFDVAVGAHEWRVQR